MQEDLLDRRRNVLGPAHPDTLDSMRKLSLWRCKRGQLAVGRALADELIAADLSLLPSEEAAKLTARHRRLHRAVWSAATSAAAARS